MGQGSEEILCREGVRSWRDKDEATAGHEGGMRVVGVLPAAASSPPPAQPLHKGLSVTGCGSSPVR